MVGGHVHLVTLPVGGAKVQGVQGRAPVRPLVRDVGIEERRGAGVGGGGRVVAGVGGPPLAADGLEAVAGERREVLGVLDVEHLDGVGRIGGGVGHLGHGGAFQGWRSGWGRVAEIRSRQLHLELPAARSSPRQGGRR